MTKKLSDQAAAIAKETAELLKHFSRDTALLMYAMQTVEKNINTHFPEGTEHKKTNNREAEQKLAKMMEDAKLKWTYAPESEKDRAREMEVIVKSGQEKIRQVYRKI